MKMLVIALIVVGLYFFYQTTVGSVNQAYTTCLEQVASATSDTKLTCGQKRIIYEDFAACIVTVQESSMLGSFIYNFTGIENKVTIVIGEHNKICKESTVKVPGEALYLGK